MAKTWQLQKAKAEFSKLIDTSRKHGPQIVTRHGKPAAVVLSVEDYDKLKRPELDFKKFLLSIPKIDDLDLSRPKDFGRKVDL